MIDREVQGDAAAWPSQRLLMTAAAMFAAYLAWQLTGLGGEGNSILIGNIAIVPPTALAAVACWAAARRCERGRVAYGWVVMGLAMVAYLLGEIAQLIYELNPGEYVFPSLADPFYLCFYPLFLTAIVLFTGPRWRRGRSLRAALDMVTIAIGGAAVVWYVVLGPTAYADTGGPLSTVVSLAYPAGDLVLIVALAQLLVDPSGHVRRRSLQLLAAAISAFIVADVVYARLVLEETYAGGNLVDTLYVAAILLFALAAGAERPNAEGAAPSGAARPHGRALALAPYLAVAAVFAVLIAAESDADFFPGLSLVLAAALAAALVALRQLLAQTELLAVHQRLRAAHRELAALAGTDPLTDLPNQRTLTATIDAALERSRREDDACALLFCDIDHFKALNDTLGHAAGDAALAEFGRVAAGALRAGDSFGRWGGEEFVAVLPNIDRAGAAAIAERVRAAVASHAFAATAGMPMTVSIGCRQRSLRRQARGSQPGEPRRG